MLRLQRPIVDKYGTPCSRGTAAISLGNAPGCKQFRKPVFSAMGWQGTAAAELCALGNTSSRSFQCQYLASASHAFSVVEKKKQLRDCLHPGAFSREIAVLNKDCL